MKKTKIFEPAIDEHADEKFALIAWGAGEIKGDRLLAL